MVGGFTVFATSLRIQGEPGKKPVVLGLTENEEQQ